MSAKTRIVVLHMKKLVFAGVITGLGILLVIFLGILLGSSHKQSTDNEAVENHVRSGCLYLFCHD